MKAWRVYDTRVRGETSLELGPPEGVAPRGPPARGLKPSPEVGPFGPASPLQEFVL